MDDLTGAPHVVLVVDDEALLRMHAADLLEGAGYRVIEAADAASALQILEARPEIRVLFTDVQMPGEDDGLALAQKVYERWPHVLLLVTSGGIELTHEDIPDDGRFVAKPYDAEVVDHVAGLIAKIPGSLEEKGEGDDSEGRR